LIVRITGKMRAHRPRAFEKERLGWTALGQSATRTLVCQIGQAECWHAVDVLAIHTQGFAAGHQDSEAGRRREHLGHIRSRRHDLLEVVEHQQQLACAQVLRQRLLE